MGKQSMFDISGKTAVITGGGGILCSEMARALAREGVRVAILDLNEAAARKVADGIHQEGGQAEAVPVNVLERRSVEAAREAVMGMFGRVDILINGAGGNKKEATAEKDFLFFDIPPEALKFVFDLNLLGTILPSQVFGEVQAKQGTGNIINISSMAAMRPLTKTVAYSAAKAAISNFTQWLAVYLGQNYSPNIRVNAIAPGFFITEQNRFLLTEQETGNLTPRGVSVIEHTPMGRFGVPQDLIGTIIWLISDAAAFVNGIVVPVDGGFSAFWGV